MENRLRQLRKKRKLTQIAMQMQTGMEQTLISKYEQGERVPPTETLMLLVVFLPYVPDRLPPALSPARGAAQMKNFPPGVDRAGTGGYNR